MIFWLTMNGIVLHREIEYRRQGQFKSGLEHFLGTAHQRDRWMSIYSGGKKVGYTGYEVERIFAAEGTEYQINVVTLHRGELPLPSLLKRLMNDSNQVDLRGRLILDEELRPLRLRLDVRLDLLEGTALERNVSAYVVGRRVEDSFSVTLSQGESDLFQIHLPLDKLTLSNGLAPTLPVAEYEVGKTYRMPVFDALSSFGLDQEEASVFVASKGPRDVDGMLVDVFELETRFRETTSHSWVTQDGRILRQDLGPPLDLTLRLESSERSARRGFEGSSVRALIEERGEGEGEGEDEDEDDEVSER